jgi:uncharacterized protein YcfJ
MNKSMIIGALFGAAVATAGGGLAGYQMLKEQDAPQATDIAEPEPTQAIAEDESMPEAAPAAEVIDQQQEPIAASRNNERDSPSKYAEVLSATPITERVETPREECHDETVTRQKPIKDTHQVAGTVIGAVAGGLLGDQLGGGGKNTGAKIAGAAAGGYAGNKVQEKIQQRATYETTERVCHTQYDTSERTVGYDVSYRLDGETGRVRMDYDPGGAIPVRNGELVLSRP